MTIDELLQVINKDLKKPFSSSDFKNSEININLLKKVDKFFDKGLNFYIDPTIPERSKEKSIFFRKNKFGTDLNLGSKKIVYHFEELKIALSALTKLSDFKLDRVLPIFSINEDPEKIAYQIRGSLRIDFIPNQRDFLKALIGKLSDKNIYVFEYVETWNKKDKSNVDGFFLHPNFIVIKRQQHSFNREIFTLAHELGHYLINEEEVESVEFSYLDDANNSKIERWCNDFAYYLLIGDFKNEFERIEKFNPSNDYSLDVIKRISTNTHLSQLALYTRLLINKKITPSIYRKIKVDLDEQFQVKQLEDKRKRELDKLNGIKSGGSVPKPIDSPLFISTLQTAYYSGLINEAYVGKLLNISPDKISDFLE